MLDPMKKKSYDGVRGWARSRMGDRLSKPATPAVSIEVEGGEDESAEAPSDLSEETAMEAPTDGPMGGESETPEGGIPMTLSPEEAAMIKEMRAAKQSEPAPDDGLSGLDLSGIEGM